MIVPSLPSFRASAALLLALTLPACFSTHRCTDAREDTLVEGHLDYAFNDGTQTSAALAPADLTTTASAEEGTVVVTWNAALATTTGDAAGFLLSTKLPDADGSFDLDTLSAEVCACRSGFVSLSGSQATCLSGLAMTPPPVECQPATGHLEVHRMKIGVCGSKGGCRDATAVELLLTSPAEKGLSGNFSFMHTSSSILTSCSDFPFQIG